jgi:hypothetical protein
LDLGGGTIDESEVYAGKPMLLLLLLLLLPVCTYLVADDRRIGDLAGRCAQVPAAQAVCVEAQERRRVVHLRRLVVAAGDERV